MPDKYRKGFSRIDALGRVVIPAQLRRRWALEPGQEYTIEEGADGALIVRSLQGACSECGRKFEAE